MNLGNLKGASYADGIIESFTIKIISKIFNCSGGVNEFKFNQ